jgi:hypothetical protein
MAKKKVTKKKAPAKKKVAKKKAPAKRPAAKKKAPAKKRPTRAAGAKRPSYKASASATKAMTKRRGLFFDLPANSRTQVRVMPRFDKDEDGEQVESIMVKNVLHYNLKDKDGEGIALGCLDEHGTAETGDYCYMCALAEWLAGQEDPNLHKLGTGFGSLEAEQLLYIQAWLYTPGTKEWEGPKIIKIKPTLANKLGDLISSAEDFGQTPFVDPDEGQVVVLTKTGEKKQTRYDVITTGNFINMDDVDENWVKTVIMDLPSKLDVKVWDIDEQKKAAVRTYPDFPWDEIEDDIG